MGGYNAFDPTTGLVYIIAKPSEMGGYNAKVTQGDEVSIIAKPSEMGGYNAVSLVKEMQRNFE
jgi:hypothetical protein